MSDVFVAEIRMVGFNFAPIGWAFTNGQLMAISQNTALFSLLGTNYGGNGQTTFALPNMQGRMPLHWGQGPGLSAHDLGTMGGVEFVTRQTAQTLISAGSPAAAVKFQQQVPMISPFLAVNFIIALQGIFPARN
jgi:microcystin-dependent protein